MELRPSYPVRTERLSLRPATGADVDALVRYRGVANVCRWVPFEPMDAEVVRARIAGPWSVTELDSPGQSLTLLIELTRTGAVVGDIVLFFHSAEHRSGELGWVIDPAEQGHGYGTEAARALLDLGFRDLGLHRIVARVDARNEPSARLAHRLGMTQEAHLRQNEWFKGGWSDELVFALLESEWPPPA